MTQEDDGSRMPEDLEAVLEAADEAEEAEEAEKGRYDAPPLPPALILAVVGLLCGFATIALVWLSERSCERFRDTTNCGALGLPLLVLIVVVTMVLGGLALSRLAMPHPKLVPFLGVAFMVALVVAFLTGHLDSPWILAVVPALTAFTFLLANLVARLLERADA
jgi:Na+/alanine symporter